MPRGSRNIIDNKLRAFFHSKFYQCLNPFLAIFLDTLTTVQILSDEAIHDIIRLGSSYLCNKKRLDLSIWPHVLVIDDPFVKSKPAILNVHNCSFNSLTELGVVLLN